MWAAHLLEEGVTSVLENGGTRIVGRLRDVLRESCVFIITSAGDVQHSRRRAAIALIDVFGKVPESDHVPTLGSWVFLDWGRCQEHI